MNIGCILLAAGSGRRFGGDKLRYAVGGVSLLERACRLHADIEYAERILVARPSDEWVHAMAATYGYTLVLNEHAEQGIGTSAAAGALALDKADIDGALFAVCDQPYLTAATIQLLLRQFAVTPDAIVAPAYREKRGNPVLFPRALLGSFASLSGDVGGSAIIRANPKLLITVPVADASELFDVDVRPEESRNTSC